MANKPDVIRAVVIVFAIGLAVTGITSLQASESGKRGHDRVIELTIVPGGNG